MGYASYFVRLTYSYADISGVIRQWAMKCEKMAVYEHEGAETKKVHCHIAIQRVCVCKKQLRNIANSIIDIKGNEKSSFKELDMSQTPFIYMTKGTLEPKYLQGYEKEDADKWKSLYIPKRKHNLSNGDHYYNCFGIKKELLPKWSIDAYNNALWDDISCFDNSTNHECVCEWKNPYELIKKKKRKEQFDKINHIINNDEDDITKRKSTIGLDKEIIAENDDRSEYLEIIKRAHYYTMEHFKYATNAQKQCRAMLVQTYCFRHEIKIFGKLDPFA